MPFLLARPPGQITSHGRGQAQVVEREPDPDRPAQRLQLRQALGTVRLDHRHLSLVTGKAFMQHQELEALPRMHSCSTGQTGVGVSMPAPQGLFGRSYNLEKARSWDARANRKEREIVTQGRLTPSET